MKQIIKLSEDYSPELGQALFGQPYQQLGVPGNVENVLRSIRAIMELNSIDNDYTPFDNSGMQFKNDVFEVYAYDWSECSCQDTWNNEWDEDKCTCGWRPQTYNFKWKDFEVSWYKYLGRGMSMNRKIPKQELKLMAVECINSLM